MDRGSLRALAVAAGDGAGRHMVKVAHGVVMGRLLGQDTKRATPRCDSVPMLLWMMSTHFEGIFGSE